METNMIEIFELSDTGIAYQLLVETGAAGNVVVDCSYYIDENEYRLMSISVEPSDNLGLSPHEISKSNIEIQQELYPEISQFLEEHYAATEINYTT